MTCDGCGGSVDTRGFGWAQEVTGWEIKRRSGGANQITAPKRHNKYLCNMCVVRLKAIKVPQEQGTLL